MWFSSKGTVYAALSRPILSKPVTINDSGLRNTVWLSSSPLFLSLNFSDLLWARSLVTKLNDFMFLVVLPSCNNVDGGPIACHRKYCRGLMPAALWPPEQHTKSHSLSTESNLKEPPVSPGAHRYTPAWCSSKSVHQEPRVFRNKTKWEFCD